MERELLCEEVLRNLVRVQLCGRGAKVISKEEEKGKETS